MRRVQAACDITYGMLNPDVVEIDGADEERDNEIIIPKGTRGERAFIFGPEANDLVKFENGEQWYIDKAWFEPAPRLKETRTMSNPYPAPIKVYEGKEVGEFRIKGMNTQLAIERVLHYEQGNIRAQQDVMIETTATKLERAYNFCDIDPAKLEGKHLSELLQLALEYTERVMDYAESEANYITELGMDAAQHVERYNNAEKFVFELREMLGLE